MARRAAAARHLALDTVVADLAAYDYGVARYDLVTLIYAPPALKRLADIQKAVRPGGLVVYEFFAKDADNQDAPERGEIAKQFGDGWEVVRDDFVDAVPDWGSDRAKLERFVARKRR